MQVDSLKIYNSGVDLKGVGGVEKVTWGKFLGLLSLKRQINVCCGGGFWSHGHDPGLSYFCWSVLETCISCQG